MTFVTTLTNRCKHLWPLLLQKFRGFRDFPSFSVIKRICYRHAAK